MIDISIIGAGLSGSLLAMNLLKQECGGQVRIKLIDRASEQNLGPAYSTNEDHLLNVPAGIMGAFSEYPDHFLQWAREKNIKAEEGDYLPRKLYRAYIHAMLQQALNETKQHKSLERIQGEALDMSIDRKRAKISVAGYGEIQADKVVLALGNSLPRTPQLKKNFFISDNRYLANPWNGAIFKNSGPDDTLLFIGTGQTMVDLATGLFRKGHKGKIKAISRRGILPLSQKRVEPYSSFFDELRDQRRILPIFRTVRKHIEIANEKGLDPRSVIDSLRPHTTAIWMQLPPAEKRRFLRHVFRYWEIIRSRIPPQSEVIIRELRASGQLQIMAGRIIDILPQKDSIVMRYAERESKLEKTTLAHFVINCMGPNLDYEQIDQPFIKNLIAKKIIHCDPCHLGIDALPNGSILGEDGTPSDIIYTIGLTLKGIVWEALATPEIRVQAENLARRLLLN